MSRLKRITAVHTEPQSALNTLANANSLLRSVLHPGLWQRHLLPHRNHQRGVPTYTHRLSALRPKSVATVLLILASTRLLLNHAARTTTWTWDEESARILLHQLRGREKRRETKLLSNETLTDYFDALLVFPPFTHLLILMELSPGWTNRRRHCLIRSTTTRVHVAIIQRHADNRPLA